MLKPCPKCGGKKAKRHFACRECWEKIPVEIRKQMLESSGDSLRRVK
jgi:hypothetical protein